MYRIYIGFCNSSKTQYNPQSTNIGCNLCPHLEMLYILPELHEEHSSLISKWQLYDSHNIPSCFPLKCFKGRFAGQLDKASQFLAQHYKKSKGNKKFLYKSAHSHTRVWLAGKRLLQAILWNAWWTHNIQGSLTLQFFHCMQLAVSTVNFLKDCIPQEQVELTMLHSWNNLSLHYSFLRLV